VRYQAAWPSLILARYRIGLSPTDAAPASQIGGYSLIRADDLDAAVGLVKNHPFVGRGGSLQVSEAVAP
jgi:hypothetical protein